MSEPDQPSNSTALSDNDDNKQACHLEGNTHRPQGESAIGITQIPPNSQFSINLSLSVSVPDMHIQRVTTEIFKSVLESRKLEIERLLKEEGLLCTFSSPLSLIIKAGYNESGLAILKGSVESWKLLLCKEKLSLGLKRMMYFLGAVDDSDNPCFSVTQEEAALSPEDLAALLSEQEKEIFGPNFLQNAKDRWSLCQVRTNGVLRYSLPKGRKGLTETFEETAYRETFEECNVPKEDLSRMQGQFISSKGGVAFLIIAAVEEDYEEVWETQSEETSLAFFVPSDRLEYLIRSNKIASPFTINAVDLLMSTDLTGILHHEPRQTRKRKEGLTSKEEEEVDEVEEDEHQTKKKKSELSTHRIKHA
eukprot:TRINITY_DN25264_c0_g2_i1.p1 TRINITY_DN25264_c0_g2~~TRINITY_DN25264_c0_g2_i1.p1  ORF type:complete len:363 (+),score=78.34 TRINITY_DN25264_c0_g2_i1:14-1102(+)